MHKTDEHNNNKNTGGVHSNTTKSGYNFSDLPIRDSLEVTPDMMTNKTKKQQLIYDSKLNCYYDPTTNEYFELKNY